MSIKSPNKSYDKDHFVGMFEAQLFHSNTTVLYHNLGIPGRQLKANIRETLHLFKPPPFLENREMQEKGNKIPILPSPECKLKLLTLIQFWTMQIVI